MYACLARDRAYEYHLECILRANRVEDLSKYSLILNALQHDPDGKLPVSVPSLLVRAHPYVYIYSCVCTNTYTQCIHMYLHPDVSRQKQTYVRRCMHMCVTVCDLTYCEALTSSGPDRG